MQKNVDTRSVMQNKLRIYWLLIPILIIVLLDEWMKTRALAILPNEIYLTEPSLINFAVHKNFGLAFDLPFRLELVIGFSVLIGFFLLRTAWKAFHTKPDIAFACLMIVFGALGNLYDRIVYGYTVDYIFLLGRSAINFSDLIIILGVIALLLLSSKKNRVDKLLHSR